MIVPGSGAPAAISLDGEFDLHTAHLIASAITTAVERGARQLVLDLRRATFFDCATLHALMSAAEPLRSEPAASITVTGAQGIVQRFLALVGVGPLIPLGWPRDDAIAVLRPAAPDQGLMEMAR
jgi:anti-anti-sigma factor